MQVCSFCLFSCKVVLLLILNNIVIFNVYRFLNLLIQCYYFAVAQARKGQGSHVRSQKSTPKKFVKRKQPLPKPTSLIDDRSDWNGTMFPFRGTKELYEEENEPEKKSDFEDDEWEESSSKSGVKIKLNNALGSLMCAYNSSDDSEIEGLEPEVKNRVQVPKVELTKESDDEAPVEEKIVKEISGNLQTVDENSTTNQIDEKIASGRKRKRTHRRQTNKKRIKYKKKDGKKSGGGSNLFFQKFKKRRVTLLDKLLASEIRHERNVLLQCVRFVVQNNFFINNVEK